MPSDIPEPWNDWETFVAAVLEEDRRAVLAFAESVGFMARGILRRKHLSPADADDLAATCVTEIFLKLRRFGGGFFPAWARTLILRELSDHFRKRARSVVAHWDARLEQRSNGASETRHASPLIRGSVGDALATLAEEERLIVQLRYCGETVEYKEIAAVLGIREGTARVRCQRVRDKLERLLRDDARMAPLLAKWDAISDSHAEKTGDHHAKYELQP
jgi:RNA polymerase sigma factor (sigma-70 family)